MTDKTTVESKIYHFGGFELNLALGELHQAGEVVDVQKRVFDLLVFLVLNRDRTVGKDELQAAVWPGTIISETALTRAVMKARRAVGDDASQQHFIKTLHGQGYRFVASVEERSLARVGPQAPAQPKLAEPHAVSLGASSTENNVDWRVERRNAMLRLATTYGAAAWLLNQVATMLWEAFEWDKLPLQWIITITLVGFPLVLAVGWFYRATPLGLKLRSEASASIAAPSKGPYVWVIGMLSLALALSLGWNLRGSATPQAPVQVAIFPTANLTEDATLDWVGLGMLSLLTSQLDDSGLATLPVSKILRYANADAAPISPELIETLSLAEGVAVVVQTQLKTVSGRFVASGSLLQGQDVLTLPEFSGSQPSEAMRSLGDYLINHLQPSRSVDGAQMRVANTGDPFTDQAYARGMYEKLSGNLGRAKELLEVAAQGSESAFWPSYELAHTIAELGELDDAAERYHELLQRAVAQAEPLQIVVLSNVLGIHADLRGNLAESERFYQEGIRWAQTAGLHNRRAELWINYAVLERARAQPQLAKDYLGRAFAAYADANVEVLPGDFFITRGNIAADTGDVHQAQQEYQQALANFKRLDRPSGIGIALSNLSWASQVLGELDAAERYLAESIGVRREIGDQVGLVKAEVRQAGLAFSRGKLALAQASAMNVIRAPYAQQEQELLASGHHMLGAVALVQENLQKAQAQFELALSLEEAGGRVYGQLRARVALARTFMQADDFSTAREQTARVVDAAGESMPRFALQAMQIDAQILQLQGDLTGAKVLLEQALAQASRVGEDGLQALLAVDLANLALDQQDLPGAVGWAGTARQLLPDDGRVRLLSARLAFENNDANTAIELVAQAERLMGHRIKKQAQALLARYPSAPSS